jgi:hypothetical protein
MKTCLLIAISALAGCAMNYDVLKTGENSYQTSAVASPARGGIAGAQHMALESANKQCSSLGKQITVTNVETGHDYPANGRAVVTFSCT